GPRPPPFRTGFACGSPSWCSGFAGSRPNSLFAGWSSTRARPKSRRKNRPHDRTGEGKTRHDRPNPAPPARDVPPGETSSMLAKLKTFALQGIEAVPVEVEVDASAGL